MVSDFHNGSVHKLQNTLNTISISCIGTSPVYSSEFAAGADLFAYLESPITLNFGERALIPTNTYLEIPIGYEGQIRPRSGLAIKHGITLLNSPGTIDADYRGEIKVPIINLGQKAYTISNKDRIAQIVIASCVKANFVELDSKQALSTTKRAKMGFGSTGK